MATLTDFLKGIADALRTKKGTSDPIPAPTFAQEILNIQTGTDTSDATGGPSEMLAGFTAYGANGKFTGAIASVPGQIITPSTTSKTAIQAGRYASGAISVLGDPNLIAENIKSGVSIFGVDGSLVPIDFNLLNLTPSSQTSMPCSEDVTDATYVLYAFVTRDDMSDPPPPGEYVLISYQLVYSKQLVIRNQINLIIDPSGPPRLKQVESTVSYSNGNLTTTDKFFNQGYGYQMQVYAHVPIYGI